MQIDVVNCRTRDMMAAGPPWMVLQKVSAY
jgi:hypothetical protein